MAWAPEQKMIEPTLRDLRDRQVSRDGRDSRGWGWSHTSGRAESRASNYREPPLCFLIKSSMIGAVIGRGGSNIKDIQDSTSTKIQIVKGGPEAEVKIFGRNNFLQEVSSWAPHLEQALGFAFCLLHPWIRLWKPKLSFTGFGPWPWGKKSSSGLCCQLSGFQPSLGFCNLRSLFSCQLTHAFKMIIKKNSHVFFIKVG